MERSFWAIEALLHFVSGRFRHCGRSGHGHGRIDTVGLCSAVFPGARLLKQMIYNFEDSLMQKVNGLCI